MDKIIEEFYLIVSLVGGIQGLFLVFILLTKKKNKIANKIIASAIFLLSFQHILNYLLIKGVETNFPEIFGLLGIFDYAFAPIFFLYIGLLTSSIKNLRLVHLLHFIPLIIYWLFLIPYYTLPEQEQLDLINLFNQQMLPQEFIVLQILLYFQMFIYIILILFQFNKYGVNLKSYFTNIGKLNLKWLRILVIFVFFSWFTYFLSFITYFVDFELSILFDIIYTISSALFIYIIGYLALSQPEIFNQTQKMSDVLTKMKNDGEEIILSKPQIITENEKYKKTKLNENVSKEYLTKIVNYIENSEIYKDPDLTLKMFSENVDIPTHHVSQVINSSLNKNFFSFVNSYRIEAAKSILKDENFKEYNILRIAFEVGFNSKPTFNSVFKEYTKMTPTEYRKS